MAPSGLEPETLWLLAIRSDQMSYETSSEWSKGVDSSSTGANLVGSNLTAVTFAQAEQSQGHVLDHASGNKVGA